MKPPQVNRFVKDKGKAEAVALLMDNVVRISCVAYLKVDCQPCVASDLNDRFADFWNKYGELQESDPPQFYRQLVIWSKETCEVKLKKPCSIEGDEDLSRLFKLLGLLGEIDDS